MKKSFLTFLFLIFSNPAFADTTAFGLTLGKTTESEAKKMYTMEYAGAYRRSHGNMYYLRNTGIMESLKSLHLVFDKKGLLVMIQAVFPKTKEAEIFDTLSKKHKLAYNLIRSNPSPRYAIAHSRAGFDAGDTEIDMLTPMTSRETTVLYTYKPFLDIDDKIKKEEEMKEKEQMNAIL